MKSCRLFSKKILIKFKFSHEKLKAAQQFMTSSKNLKLSNLLKVGNFHKYLFKKNLPYLFLRQYYTFYQMIIWSLMIEFFMVAHYLKKGGGRSHCAALSKVFPQKKIEQNTGYFLRRKKLIACIKTIIVYQSVFNFYNL